MSRRVLVADDTEDIRLLLRVLLGRADFTIVGEAADGAQALEMWQAARDEGIHALILDHRMPQLTGLDVARQVLAESPEQRVIIFSAQVDEELRHQAAAAGVAAVVRKEDLSRITEHPALVA